MAQEKSASNLVPAIIDKELPKAGDAVKGSLSKIVDRHLARKEKDGNFSLQEIELASGKTSAEVTEIFSNKITAAPAEIASALWKSLDAKSKAQMAYVDSGTLNLDLADKLKLRGNVFHKAFTDLLARE
ncbi:MAG TPA: hypothetical protein VEA58_06560, partial [Anaerovoracaceae bacterium]|nr:hypothetical protein [Anaerovoracaceae bacterium]